MKLLTLESATEFRKKYLPVFVISLFLGLVSSLCALVLSWGTYFRSVSPDLASGVSFTAVVMVIVFKTVCCVRILNGHSRWSNGLIVLFSFNLIFSVFTIFYGPHFGLYATALSVSLMGLYYLNTESYRAMLLAAEGMRLEGVSGPQPRLEISENQVAINNRAKETPKRSLVVSGCSIMIFKFIFWIMSIFHVFVIGLKLYLICDGLLSGAVVAANRYGPLNSYMLADEPWMYGLSMIMHLLTIGACVLFLKLMLLLRK